MVDKQDLQGLVAVVTGGNSGIGAGICVALAAEGVKVVVAGRNLEKCDKVVSDITNSGGQAIPFQSDVTVMDDATRLMAAAKESFGSLDILVNNAGVGVRHAGYDQKDNLQECSSPAWHDVLNTNLNGSYYCSHEAFKIMTEGKRGHIIMMASQAAGWPRSDIAYGVSKTAMATLGLHIHYAFLRTRKELGVDDFHSHVICPGGVDTPWYSDRTVDPTKSLSIEDVADLTLAILHEPAKPMRYFQAMSKAKPYCVGGIGVLEPHDIFMRIYKNPFNV